MINEVIPGLYIGDQMVAQNKQILQKIGITHIVNLTQSINYFATSFNYYQYKIHDKPSQNILSKKLAAVLSFIRHAIKSDDISKKSD